ncbi:MAG: hypothetical protein A2X13_14305 [Bacteroidetes bacterium GWC2_33_15]|nr:MAG: hypothetical protein A2X10_12350 [Bacteroidetes bacterium GWA2_33_15]OFX50047.1 MAG: hypothetical protein A2X13_14305 [Bacteroidetes bacterium GWC2_33_15]OFX65200.1 MAG: hypothetical protein A2X15_03880 [Bacteroidetes bacterium GWB2_32_14]OFX70426.1 MAG: hypothetical protein A2X14_03935 [Bacteroidetes bacterium GWD2_33_33]HAN19705.1 hypothetical protein [Bacteroidales bacterium]
MIKANKENRIGLTGTIIFHTIIVLLVVFFGYSTPLPLPSEEGILVNFGTDDEGLGETEPKYSESIEKQAVNKESEQELAEEAVSDETNDGNITQDFEEAPVVKEQAKKEEKKVVKTETKPKQQAEEKTEEKQEQKVNELALFPGHDRNSDSSSGEGETQGDGNQGYKTGSVDSDNHTGGNSTGGNGTDYSLSGRNPESIPKPEYTIQIDGKVVVEITVDKNGVVTDAVPGVKGSTTLDANLLAAAKRAALKAKFDRNPDAPAFQKGTITYYFKLQ